MGWPLPTCSVEVFRVLSVKLVKELISTPVQVTRTKSISFR